MEIVTEVGAVIKVSLITDILAKHLKDKDLKSCRCVSKDWYDWFSPYFRKKANLVICKQHDFKKLEYHPDDNYLRNPHIRVVFKMKMLEGAQLRRCLKPFWNSHGYKLFYLRLENVETIGADLLVEILCRQAPNLKKLVIIHCFREIVNGKKFLNQMNQLPENLQRTSLRHLEIENIAHFQIREVHMQLLKVFLRIYPDISTLRLNRSFLGDEPALPDLEKLFIDLVDKRKSNPEKYDFKELDIYYANAREVVCIELPFLKTLEGLQNSLETLKIDIGKETEPEIFAGILRLYQKTLRKLDIYRSGCASPYTDFPFGIELSSLKVLMMSDTVAATMGFLKLMPNLKRIHICGWAPKTDFCWIPVLSTLSGKERGDSKAPINIIERTNTSDMDDVELKFLKDFSFGYEYHSKEMQDKLLKWIPGARIKWYLNKPDEKVPRIR